MTPLPEINNEHDTAMNDLYLGQLDKLEENDGDGLTDWEIGFCESIRNRMECGDGLTSKQAQTLSRIWQEKASHTP